MSQQYANNRKINIAATSANLYRIIFPPLVFLLFLQYYDTAKTTKSLPMIGYEKVTIQPGG
jgi:hypothetical protein